MCYWVQVIIVQNLFLLKNIIWLIINEFHYELTGFRQKFAQSEKFKKDCGCPVECSTDIYKFTTSIAEFPTATYSKDLNHSPVIRKRFGNSSIGFEEIKENVAKVVIFYDDLKMYFIDIYSGNM